MITFDFILFSALQDSLLASGLSEPEIEEVRKQNQAQFNVEGASEDLSAVMELSKREEEARLIRLREEEEELEKVYI